MAGMRLLQLPSGGGGVHNDPHKAHHGHLRHDQLAGDRVVRVALKLVPHSEIVEIEGTLKAIRFGVLAYLSAGHLAAHGPIMPAGQAVHPASGSVPARMRAASTVISTLLSSASTTCTLAISPSK